MGCLGSKDKDELEKAEKGRDRRQFKWSYDCVEEKRWKGPGKDEFIARFREEGETAAEGRAKMEKHLNSVELEGETRVWMPGELDGYDITFDKCNGCDFYVLDITSQVQIDNCENCRFFIAPCVGSVFIRNSKNNRFILAASQVRLYQCNDTKLMMYVPRRAVLECCKGLSVACWNLNYFQLPTQFSRCQLSLFDNGWYNYDDFGTGSAPKVLPVSTTPDDIMSMQDRPWKNMLKELDGEGEVSEQVMVPLTSGIRKDDGCFVLFSPSLGHVASLVTGHFSGGYGGKALDLAATREFGAIDDTSLEKLFTERSKFGKQFKQRSALFGKGPVIGCLVTGASGAGGIIRGLLRTTGVCLLGEADPDLSPDLKAGQVYIWEGSSAKKAASFFLDELKTSLDG
eukprot:TRINITY_DN8595_c0_g1_i1.p1 TRINITY_DN8595_c0_g1~~TRINITY_DN8595_c0_g1_i1.p1  ORF type:complete len:399 (+),score=76.10 TRINITY_DN8595_c0_g1_i1:1297-2493(+)